MASLWLVIISSIFSTVLILVLIFVLIKSFRNRKLLYNRAVVEESLNEKMSTQTIYKIASKYSQEERFAESIIALFFIFKIYCKNNLSIRRALTMPAENLLPLIAGVPEISMKKANQALKLYKQASETSLKMTRTDFLKVRAFIADILKDDLS